MPFAGDRDEQFVHVPDVPKSALPPPEACGRMTVQTCCTRTESLRKTPRDRVRRADLQHREG
jgi:hypothetical protein